MSKMSDRHTDDPTFDPDHATEEAPYRSPEQLHEDATNEVWSKFETGDYDDELKDTYTDRDDAYRIALHYCYGGLFREPACSVIDFRASVQGFLNDKINDLVEDWR